MAACLSTGLDYPTSLEILFKKQKRGCFPFINGKHCLVNALPSWFGFPAVSVCQWVVRRLASASCWGCWLIQVGQPRRGWPPNAAEGALGRHGAAEFISSSKLLPPVETVQVSTENLWSGEGDASKGKRKVTDIHPNMNPKENTFKRCVWEMTLAALRN